MTIIISAICQSILTNEVSECEKLNCTSFDNLYFLSEDENLEIADPKATVRKLLLSSIIHVLNMIQRKM